MKILAIGGSPKKGNTHSVLNKIKDDNPDIDVKLLMLNKVNLELCRGCYTCVRLGEDKCPLKDDRDMIINEMFDADGVIFASQVYVNHATALMKNFMERLGYEAHRPRFYDKFAMVVAVCGMFGSKETNQIMNNIFTSFGFNVISSLELQISTETEKERVYNHDKISDAFKKFVAGIKKGERNKPTMGQIIRFYLFKSLSRMLKEYFKADYEYYKLNRNFPLDISPSEKEEAKETVKNMLDEYVKVHI